MPVKKDELYVKYEVEFPIDADGRAESNGFAKLLRKTASRGLLCRQSFAAAIDVFECARRIDSKYSAHTTQQFAHDFAG